MSDVFYISKSGEQLGPWTVEEIIGRISDGTLTLTDFAYDSGREDWVALIDFGPVKNSMHAHKPKAPPKAAAKVTPVTKGEEWFIHRGELRYGPFTYFGLLQALQEKKVFDFDLAWCEGMADWQRVATIEKFKADKIREMVTADSAKNIFSMRKSPRISVESEVLVHNNQKVSIGRTFQLGTGGMGIVVSNSGYVPGEQLNIQFSAVGEIPAFTVAAEIVNKSFSGEVRDPREAIPYAVRFLDLSKATQETLAEGIRKAK